MQKKLNVHALLDVRMNRMNVAGALFFIAGTLILLGIITAEAIYPNYSVSQNYISDLGGATNGTFTQPAAALLNTTLIVAGALIIGGAYEIHRALDTYVFFSALPLLIALGGIGTVGVGIFNETFGIIHWLVSGLTFIAGAFAAITSFRHQNAPFRYFSLILGVISLVFIVGLNTAEIIAFIGVGGAERWVVYPLTVWLIGFGGYLMATSLGAGATY